VTEWQPGTVTLATVQAQFAAGWLCWPGLAGACHALQLRPWFTARELVLAQAASPAGLRDLLEALSSPASCRCADQATPALARTRTTPSQKRRRPGHPGRPGTSGPATRRRQSC
jgi:hypothetical protein